MVSSVVYKEEDSLEPHEEETEELEDLFSNFQVPDSMKERFGVHEGKFNPKEVKFLVYGESGSGKTRFASTWPKCAFLDLDKGMASIQRKVFRFNIDTWEDLLESVNYLQNERTPFETIVFDSLNELQNLSLRHIVERYPSIRRPYDSIPGQSDYGKMLDDFDLLIREIKSIKKNIVFIAQVAPRVYETDPVQPQFTGKSTARNVSRMMDIVGYLDKREGDGRTQRVMVFDAVNYVTKDRSDVLPKELLDPTYEMLAEYWNAKRYVA